MNTDSSDTDTNNDNQIKNFARLLRNHSSNNFRNLYSCENYKTSRCKYNPNEVVSRVASTVNCIQKADKIKLQKRSVIPDKYKKTFWSVNCLANKKVDNRTTIAECGSDTQNMVDIAEVLTQIISHKGVTQEFDMSFHPENKKSFNKMIVNENCDAYDFEHDVIVTRLTWDSSTQILSITDNSTSKQSILKELDLSKQNTEEISTDTISGHFGKDKIKSPILSDKKIFIKPNISSEDITSKQSRIIKSGSSKQNTEEFSTDTISENFSIDKIKNPVLCDTGIFTIQNISKSDCLQGPSKDCDVEVQGNTDNVHDENMVVSYSQIFDYSQLKNPSPHLTDLGTTLTYRLHTFEKFEKLAFPIVSTNKYYNADVVKSQIRTKLYKLSLKNGNNVESIQDDSESENITPGLIDYDYEDNSNDEKFSGQNILDEEPFNNDEKSAAELTSSSSTVKAVNSKFGGFQTKSIENSCQNYMKTKREIEKIYKGGCGTFDTSDKTIINNEHLWQSIDSTEMDIVDNCVNNVIKQLVTEKELENDERNNTLSPILRKGKNSIANKQRNINSEVDIFDEMFDTEDFPTTEIVKITDNCKSFIEFIDDKQNTEYNVFSENQNKISPVYLSTPKENLISEEIKLIDISDCLDSDAHFEEGIDNRNIDILEKPEDNNIKEKNPCLEIRTTSNKHISEMTFIGAHNVFNKIETEGICYNDNDTIEEKLNNNEPKFSMSDNQVVELKKPLENSNKSVHIPAFAGFSTASNIKIQISDKALGKTNNIFKDVDIMTKFPGFSTASNKKVNISEKALKLGKNFIKDVEIQNDYLFTKNEMTKGESSNIPRNIKLFEDIKCSNANVNDFDDIELDEIPSSLVFSTCNNTHVNVSEKALEESKKVLNSPEINVSHNKNEVQKASSKIKVFAGFSTATNKKVTISKEALKATAHIFKGTEFSNTTENKLKSISSSVEFCKSDNTEVNISEEVLENNKKILTNSEKNAINDKNKLPKESSSKIKVFAGFSTATNKKVTISKEALKATAHIFKSTEFSNTTVNDFQENELKDIPTFVEFCKSGNTEVNISEEELENNKKILTNSEKNAINDKNKLPKGSSSKIKVFAGFSTATNKKVTISKEALKATAHIFKSTEFSNTTVNDFQENKLKDISSFVGFCKSDNTEVNISEEALENNKNILTHLEKNAINDKNKIPKEYLSKIRVFPGFSTGNNKKSTVSEKALEATVDIFKEIESNSTIVNDFQEINQPLNIDFGFESNNKNIPFKKRKVQYTDLDIPVKKHKRNYTDFSIIRKVSENYFSKQDSFSNTKLNSSVGSIRKVLSKTSLSTNKSTLKMENPIHLDQINTQLAKNFNESIHTEDFCMERSIEHNCPTSPILSRAKKRKIFHTPYNKQKKTEKTDTLTKIDIKTVEHNYKIKLDYKKCKELSLKDLIKLDHDPNVTQKEIELVDFDELINFQFNKDRNSITDDKITMQELKSIFLGLPEVNKKIVPNEWTDNHLVQISWKLISYEMKFPNTMKNCFNTEIILDQLKYRYDRELYDVQRPALRKILEKDSAPGRPIILFVMKIYSNENVESNNSKTIELQLSDGWYSMRATIDKFLEKMVSTGKITVGSKLLIQGAELINCEQGIAPWEDISHVRLKIFGNSTRRARWDAKLGFHGNGAILTRLSSVKIEGGKISKMRLFIARVYPILYMEKLDDGNTVTRSERLEHLYQAKFETDRQTALEKLIDEVNKEFDKDSVDSEDLAQNSEKKSFDTGSQIASHIRKCGDPMEFRLRLTESQMNLLDRHTIVKQEEKICKFQVRLQEKIKESCLKTDRKVIVILKARIADVTLRGGDVTLDKALLTVWSASESVIDIIREGCWVDVLNVVPTSLRFSELRLSANRQSEFSITTKREDEKISRHLKEIMRTTQTIKELARSESRMTIFNEIDTVGLVFSIEPSNQDFLKSSHLKYQTVFLCDAEKNCIRLNFLGGLKKYGYQNLIEIGQIVVCKNLQNRFSFGFDTVKQFRVTEFTLITKIPNYTSKEAYMGLCRSLNTVNIQDLCRDCVNLKSANSFVNNENVSPVRLVKTPIQKRVIDNKCEYDLSSIDFASTFNTPDELTPQQRSRKKRLNEKLDKLNMYGEPPKISPIHIINKTLKANSSYKCPVTSKNTFTNRSDINPVKLNFSINADKDVSDDFAEHFEPSQPLSLDSV